MQKSKTFTQYSGNNFNIDIKINDTGNIRNKSKIMFIGENYKKYQKEHKKNYEPKPKKQINLFTIHEDELHTTIFCIIKSNGNIQNANRIYQQEKIKISNYSKEYYIEHREEHSIKGKEWRKNNPEKILELRKKYYKENRDDIIIKSRNWKETNKEKLAETNKLYKINNIDKIKENDKKQGACRRGWGYDPINEPFEDCHFHHTHIDDDHNKGIHIPNKLHNSVWHSHKDKETMNKINKLAFEWLGNQ